MEYYSSKIHLHRPTAHFGSPLAAIEAQSSLSRHICIENAENVANAIANYGNMYGDASTMSGIALHMIATATTILIANVAEKRSTDTSRQMEALQTCIRGLCELEKTYIVARRVRRIIRLILGLCHVDIDCAPQPLQNVGRITSTAATEESSNFLDCTKFNLTDNANNLRFPDTSVEMASIAEYGSLWAEDLPVPSGYEEYDIMYNLGTFL